MIELKDLSRSYGTRKAVDSLSFTVEKGALVGLLGPNGAGKTTTMNMLAGVLAPGSGSVLINGMEPSSLSARRRTGYLPEIPPLYPEMSCKEYLRFIHGLRGGRRAGRDSALKDIAAACGIAEVFGRRIGALSHGYRQRLGLAGALVGEPELVILDEPANGLDPRQIAEMRELLRTLDATVIISTHILTEASSLCRRVLVINEGKLVADGTPDELAAAVGSGGALALRVRGPSESVLARLKRLDSGAKLSGEPEPGVYEYLIADDKRPQVLKALADFELMALVPKRVSLEEVYLKLTDGGEAKQ